METPTVVVERERVNKILFGVIVIVGILLVVGFNVWVFRYAKSGNAPSPKALWQPVTGSTLPESSSPPSTPTPTPTSTPRPTGPGEYACDPYGVCNKYSDEARKQFCSVTYADSKCLDQCGNKEKQCKQ